MSIIQHKQDILGILGLLLCGVSLVGVFRMAFVHELNKLLLPVPKKEYIAIRKLAGCTLVLLFFVLIVQVGIN